MATVYWIGGATAVAQVWSGTITGYDVATTYTVTIGDQTISTVGTGGTANATAVALVALLNATSAHPYFSTITWTAPGSGVVRGTADTAGVPFTSALTVAGGTGTVDDFAVTTANVGPCDISVTSNWSGGAIPAGNDTAILKDSSVSLLYGLNQSGVALDNLWIHQSFTGKIGLPKFKFATDATGSTFNATVEEYRSDFLQYEVTQADGRLEIGQNLSQGSPAGSGRIKIDLGSNPGTVVIHNTAAQSADSGLPCVRLKANDAATIIYIRKAPGGVGIGTDTPGETATVARVSVEDVSTSSRVFVGRGVTMTTFEQSGGVNLIEGSAGTVTTVEVNGGQLTIDGAFTITALNINAGTVVSTNTTTITAATLRGGVLDMQRSNIARTITTLNHYPNSVFKTDSDVITVTTYNELGGRMTLTASA